MIATGKLIDPDRERRRPPTHVPCRRSALLRQIRVGRQALTSLLVPTRIADLVRNEYLALLGALGVLVGLALAKTGPQRRSPTRYGM